MAPNPTYDFSGQVALVTGAGSGAAVVMADINPTALQAGTETLTTAGHQVLGVKCDVSEEASVADAVGTAVDAFGRLDMAFNERRDPGPAQRCRRRTRRGVRSGQRDQPLRCVVLTPVCANSFPSSPKPWS